MEMRHKLRMLGVKIDGPTIMYGDNQNVDISATNPSIDLKEKHNTLAYHRTREVIAAGIVGLRFIRREVNWARTLTRALPPRHFHFFLGEIQMKWNFTQVLIKKKEDVGRKERKGIE